jgi:hypothetical protein
MKGIESEDELLTFLNTPERLERISNFYIKTDIKFFEGENHIVFTCSEEVLIEPDHLSNVNQMIARAIQLLNESCVLELDDRLTNFFRAMLIFCKMKFVDEQDKRETVAAYIDDEQVVQMERGELIVFNFEKD